MDHQEAGAAHDANGLVPIAAILNTVTAMTIEQNTYYDVFNANDGMSVSLQKMSDHSDRLGITIITETSYRKMISALTKSFSNSMHPLDAALATKEVKESLAVKNFSQAIKHLIKALSKLETSARLNTAEFIDKVKALCKKGENPNNILQIMQDCNRRVKDGHQLALAAMRDLYFSLLTPQVQTAALSTKIQSEATKPQQTLEEFHQMIFPFSNFIQEPKHVIMAVEPQPAENKEARRETRGRYRSPEVERTNRSRDRSPEMERTYRSRDRERSRRPQNNYGHPQDSENAIHRRERSNSIHRSRMCRQCPAGREERHLHLPQNCKYGFQGRGGVQGRDGFGINQRNGFSQVNRGGFGNERGRGGFQILRRQN
jgi:hypothetical protein